MYICVKCLIDLKKDTFDDRPSTRPIKLARSARSVVRGGTGPRKDIVGALSEIYFKITPCTSELLEPKKEKSPTCCNFEIFDHDPSFFNFSQKKASLLLVKKKVNF